jgi:hypothetical protein
VPSLPFENFRFQENVPVAFVVRPEFFCSTH